MALGLGVCAFILALAVELVLREIMDPRMIGGIVEEVIKVVFALTLARGMSERQSIGTAGFVGIGFWTVETLCLLQNPAFLVLRVLTLVGHAV